MSNGWLHPDAVRELVSIGLEVRIEKAPAKGLALMTPALPQLVRPWCPKRRPGALTWW